MVRFFGAKGSLIFAEKRKEKDSEFWKQPLPFDNDDEAKKDRRRDEEASSTRCHSWVHKVVANESAKRTYCHCQTNRQQLNKET